MKKLQESRKTINEIDAQLVELFQKRMEAAKDIAECKKQEGLAINNPKREQELVEQTSSLIKDDLIKEYFITFYKELFEVSKAYQYRLNESMKVAYCGVEGAFGQIASKRAFPTSELISYSSFIDAYQSVVDGKCDVCVLPIENSTAGDVGDVLDLIFQGSLYINNIYELEIVHNLIGRPNSKIEEITTVMSHPQALAQCNEFIQEHGFSTIAASNTAVASLKLSQSDDDTLAVIASKETAELYGLKILANNINAKNNNTTRFAVFSKVLHQVPAKSTYGENFILVFTVKNEAGSLVKALNIIGMHNYNMRNLRSRPMKSLIWNYFFFVELEGNINTQNGQDMLTELKSVCDCLKLVGCYSQNK